MTKTANEHLSTTNDKTHEFTCTCACIPSFRTLAALFATTTLALSVAFPIAYVSKPHPCDGLYVHHVIESDKTCIGYDAFGHRRLRDSCDGCVNECDRYLCQSAPSPLDASRRMLSEKTYVTTAQDFLSFYNFS